MCIAQLAIWTVLPYLLATSLPLDVVSDGLSWGHEWQFGYYKHPPLPSWTVELAFDALGDLGPFLLSQIAVGTTYLFVFLLGRELLPVRWAAAGTLLLTGVYYFSIPTPEFNHNVAQMPIWGATAYFYLRAYRSGELRWWLALGVAAGLAFLTKYECAVLFAAVAVHLVTTRRARMALTTAGPYVAFATALAIASPNFVWLMRHDFLPLGYAQSRAGHLVGWARIMSPISFLFAQALDLAPLFIVAAITGLFGSRLPHARAIWRDDAGRFLLVVGMVPVAITVLLSLLTGFGLLSMWGAPMWNLSGLLLVYLAQARWQTASFGRLYICVAVLFLIWPACYIVQVTVGPQLLHKPVRTGWPDRALASALDRAWASDTGHPLRIVVGESWLAGLVAMRSNPRPSVFIDGDFRKAPWITPARLACEGALAVWQIDNRSAPFSRLAALPGFRAMGQMSFAWPHLRNVPDLKIGWGTIPPGACARRTPFRAGPFAAFGLTDGADHG